MEREAGLGAFREVPFMGVIFVVHEAMKRGFVNGHPDWSNLGQGQPEVGPMEGAPERISDVHIEPQDHAYGPLEGIPELREAVAAHYNRLYRRGLSSQYRAENVAIAQGGRLALSRAMVALGATSVGYQTPDYTAYEDMLELHLSRIATHLVRARVEDGFVIPPDRIEAEVSDKGLGAFVLSNPCNPTGALLEGDSLEGWVALARRHELSLLLDEFYSHFIYAPDGTPASGPVSAARYIEDVNRDPVILFDGLTKSFRYPGWRIGWALAPPRIVETLARTASALDGGPSRIAQRAAILALEPDRADQETHALREGFASKRREMLRHLRAMGIRFPHEPRGTFYCWGSLEELASPFDDAMSFFWRALEHKVMTVPGQFFDVDPGKRRKGASPYEKWMRFSFGPPMQNMILGLERLEAMYAAGTGTR
jgi:aspartate/methionine/tyrosine aminotransferase